MCEGCLAEEIVATIVDYGGNDGISGEYAFHSIAIALSILASEAGIKNKSDMRAFARNFRTNLLEAMKAVAEIPDAEIHAEPINHNLH